MAKVSREQNQEIKIEVTVRFDPNNRNGLGEFFISDCRAEALTQVESLTAVIAYGARDIAHQSINQYLKQHNPVF
ncbi:hypothetical protein [Vibrio rumoiensis]|uniref:hypothetical protein n=1 Tax=Vibrio rumoiensis TaxID=76258 RepID=UPI003AA9AF3F